MSLQSLPVCAPTARVPASPTHRRSLFPVGVDWEITPERAAHWFAHRFSGLRGETQFSRRLGPLDADEMALLMADLDCYEGLLRRYERGQGTQPPPLHEYLRPGREQWGALARLVRAMNQVGAGPDEPAPPPALDGRSKRDRALLALVSAGFSVSELVALDLANVDLDFGRIGRRQVDAAVLDAVAAYLDERPDPDPDTPGDPLFVSCQGGRLVPRAVRRIAQATLRSDW